MDLKIIPLQRGHESILWEFQYYAALMDEEGEPKESIYTHPYAARYVKHWGRPGDFGFVTSNQTNAEVVGALWCRLWGEAEQGYGYVAAHIPELSIAVLPKYRHKGVGTALLRKLLEHAEHTAQPVSLAVRSTNKAVSLYEKLGFARILGKDFMNRSAVLSYVMIYVPKTASRVLN